MVWLLLGKSFISNRYKINLENQANIPCQLELPLVKAYPAGGDVMVENLWYKDAQEGIQVKYFAFPSCWILFSQAFKEKRKPVFTHGDEKAAS